MENAQNPKSFLNLTATEQAQLLENLPEHQLKQLIKIASKTRKKQFKHGPRKPLYGRRQRHLTPKQVSMLFAELYSWRPRVALYAELLLLYGLRVSEPTKVTVLCHEDPPLLMIGDINDPAKSGSIDYLPVYTHPEATRRAFLEVGSMSPNYVRNTIRQALRRCGLLHSHGLSSDGRQLYPFTPHSLRHTALDWYGQLEDDPAYYFLFSRHESKGAMGVGLTYRHPRYDVLVGRLRDCFYEFVLNCPELLFVSKFLRVAFKECM
jgi:integrase